MDTRNDPKKLPPHFQGGVAEILAAQGVGAAAASALMALDADFFLWHRAVMKGELPALLIRELGADIELSHFYALSAVTRIENGIGRAAPEPATVGLLAEELNVDPSRASRVAADLIQRGYLARGAVQEDGRKSIQRLTPRAVSLFQRFRDRKWSLMLEVFDGWSDADIESFGALFRRYSEAAARVYQR